MGRGLAGRGRLALVRTTPDDWLGRDGRERRLYGAPGLDQAVLGGVVERVQDVSPVAGRRRMLHEEDSP